MKKLYTRIAACSLAVLIAFNTVAIPKAEAVIAESALVSAFVATYSAAAGFSFRGEPFPGAEQMPAVVRSIETFIEDFAEAREMTRAQFEEEILASVKFVGDGVVKIGSAAAGLLASFTDWLVDVLWIANGMSNTDPVGFVPGEGIDFPALPVWNVSVYPYATLFQWLDGENYYFIRVTEEPLVNDQGSLRPLSGAYYSSYDLDFANMSWSESSSGFWAAKSCFSTTSYSIVWANHDVLNGDGTVYVAASDVVESEDWENPVLYATLSPDYEAAPTVDEQYAMVIDTGMTIEDEQDFVDSVLGGMLAGTLAPTYTIEQAAGGDVVVPDEETDTQAGILSSVKNIAQNVIALPQTIAEKIKGIFVPDAALTTEITDAFAAKFSFVPTLHRLGTDLLSIGPDSKPPVVYIHLEDAEGAIDYGGTTKALDMSWYQRYKEDGDRIIGGFLWLGFLWLLFKRVPAIINGGEMVQEYTAAIDRGSKRRKH